MEIEVIKIDLKEFKEQLYPTYKELFPAYERKSLKMIKDLVVDGCTSLYKFVIEGDLVGFSIIHQIENNPYIMVEYFAILPELQNKGYGTLCAYKLKEIYKNLKGLTVEVEKPDNNDLLKERRIKFYERLGLKKVNAEYRLFDVEFYPYVWNFSNSVDTDADIIKYMFDIYRRTLGKELTEKYCKVIKL